MTTEYGESVRSNHLPIIARGMNLVAGKEQPGGGPPFRAIDPTTGKSIGPSFHSASPTDVAEAVESAVRVHSDGYMQTGLTIPLLRVTAQLLEDSSEIIVTTSMRETGLHEDRLKGELQRTAYQLRFLAEVAERGERLDATIDHIPQQGTSMELRKVRLPIGPVVVFGASNFPLAFSVLGGDTASALAAGCPVIIKAHPAHPATSELCGRILSNAIDQCGLDPGWFSLLHGNGPAIGAQLVQAAGIGAVAFTGSLRGGRSLFDLAVRRPDPIPVFAEMGSMNPVFISSAAIRHHGKRICEQLVESIASSAGQLCTKPGLIFLPEGNEGDQFERDLSDAFENRLTEPMLTREISESLSIQIQSTSAMNGVENLGCQSLSKSASGLLVAGRLFKTSLEVFRDQPALQTEHFGASAILVSCPESEFPHIPHILEGSLTGSLFFESEEEQDMAKIIISLAQRVGRVVVNGVPTGVSVARGMTHGGPYPATTSTRDTSVGSAALDRFLRPVTFQNVPNLLLPLTLRSDNPLGIPRSIDGNLNGPVIRG